MPSLERRFKRIAVDFDVELSKWEVMAIMRKLPDDSVVIRLGEDYAHGCSYLVVHSDAFELVPEGEMIPFHDVWISHAEIEAEAERARSQGLFPYQFGYDKPGAGSLGAKNNAFITTPHPLCICDFAYTGARHHRPNCPVRRAKGDENE